MSIYKILICFCFARGNNFKSDSFCTIIILLIFYFKNLKLILNDKDFNRNDSDSTIDAKKTTIDTGVHTSNRIRVKHPGIENVSYVKGDIEVY